VHSPIVNDSNFGDFFYPVIDGEQKSHGLIPRDYSTHPEGCFAWAEPFPDSLLVPEDEIDGRLQEMKGMKASLLDLRELYYGTLKSLDQDGKGLCWAFSSTKATMYLFHKMMNAPMVLSAWWVAGKVKHWADQGGWGGESINQIATAGAPLMSFCPGYQSSYDNAACQENAALHKIVKWYEGSQDKDKAFHQQASAHCLGLPCVGDYNFLSHSMCIAWTDSYKSPQAQCDNSWGENAGNKGLYQLQGNKAKPDGLWIPYLVTPSLQ